jgi:hypothetical protein
LKQKYRVGQEVWMRSGPYAQKGKVVKVGWWSVEVELDLVYGPIGRKHTLRFDTRGKARYSGDLYTDNMEWDGIPGTHECGPWELDPPPPDTLK